MGTEVRHAFEVGRVEPHGEIIADRDSAQAEPQPLPADLPLGKRDLHEASRPWRTVGILVASDLVCLSIANALTVWVRYLLGGKYQPSLYWQLWPVLGLFLLVYAAVGLYSGVALYPGVALGPIKELRRASLATTWVYLTLGMSTFFLRSAETYSRSIFLVGWVSSLLLVPLGRVVVRHFLARREWWGHPVLVFGAGSTARLVITALQRHPILGLKPVAVLDDDPGKHGSLCGVPVPGGLELAPILARKFRIHYAIVAMPGVPGQQRLELYQRYGRLFPHLLIIPEMVGFSSMWVVAKDLGGVLGLELRQNLLLRGPQLLKRAFDVVVTILGGLPLLPLIGFILLLIKLESRGPGFYGQKRVGQSGHRFKAWKFRTMVVNGDRVLARYFDHHPELIEEWMTTQKLKHDPRVTRVGRLLRKTSLDELPQIWNVLRGEMSLVGPRPIIAEEIPRYGDKFSLYCKVLPGLTGLWQVSGRNNLPYEERVGLDAYYVYNWSVWFDIYILARTIRVVLFGDGAY